MTFFTDRVDAGKRLASALKDFSGKNGIVLAIPRGGVVVGFEIARALNLPLRRYHSPKDWCARKPRVGNRRCRRGWHRDFG